MFNVSIIFKVLETKQVGKFQAVNSKHDHWTSLQNFNFNVNWILSVSPSIIQKPAIRIEYARIHSSTLVHRNIQLEMYSTGEPAITGL